MSPKKNYYVIEYKPDGHGAPYFIDKYYKPELPDYDLFNQAPRSRDFQDAYSLRALVDDLSADYLPDDNLVSFDFLALCHELKVSFFSRPLTILLKKKKIPDKMYALFFIGNYVSILDSKKSIFETSKLTGYDVSGDDDSNKRIHYENITSFVVREDIEDDLLWCVEVSKPVCSELFKSEFLAKGLSGVEFVPIDASYRYDPWADF